MSANANPENDTASSASSDFVYVDVEGEPLDATIEASCRMAADLFSASTTSAAGKQQQNLDDHGTVATSSGEDDTQTEENLFKEDFEHAKRFFAANAREAVFDFCSSSSSSSSDRDENENEEKEEQAEMMEDDEEDGMDSCNRANSDALNDDDWILEKVLRRRAVKQSKSSSNQHHLDDADNEDAIHRQQGPATRASSSMKMTEYLIKWKFYADPTWEPKEWLEDQGWAKELEEYDLALRNVAVSEKKRKMKALAPSTFLDLRSYWPDWEKRIESAFRKQGLTAKDIMYCAPPHAITAFMRNWKQSNAKECAPTMLFHGTRGQCVGPILSVSLQVPGSFGVRVLCGSAYGVGIYTARNPGFSSGYSDPYGYMFVCAGLAGSKYSGMAIAPTSDIVVFKASSYVVPVWLVRFERGTPVDPDHQMTVRTTFEEMQCFNPQGRVPAPVPTANMRTAVTGGHGATKAPPPPPKITKSAVPTVTEEGTNDANVVSASRKYGAQKMTKKMLRQAPKALKEIYRTGELRQKKTGGQKK